jgi:soluble lytic murein transglycosylase-like protein
MAVTKALGIRDYLEPRYAAAAGSGMARALRKGPGSFNDILKSQASKAPERQQDGLTISDYLKNPVRQTQAARPPSTAGARPAAAAGPRAAEALEQPAVTRRAAPKAPAASLRTAGGKKSRPPSQSTLQQHRADMGAGGPVEQSIQQAAAKYDLAPDLIRSVIRAESNFQADAVSTAGAKGLMQLMPETARELGVTNAFDIRQNVDGGSRYLRQMLDRFGGDLKLALAAYNAGPGAVEQHNGDVPYAETRQYVKRVLRFAGIRT